MATPSLRLQLEEEQTQIAIRKINIELLDSWAAAGIRYCLFKGPGWRIVPSGYGTRADADSTLRAASKATTTSSIAADMPNGM